MLKKLISYYKPYKKMFTFVMIIDIVICFFNMCYPIITRNMLNDYIPNKQFNLMIIFGIALIVIYILTAILEYLFTYYGHVVGTNIQRDMRNELFIKLEKLPFKYFDNNETGKIMSHITHDLQDISELAHHGPEMIFMATTSLIFAFVYLSNISFKLTIIIFSCIPFLVVITTYLRKKHTISTRKARVALAQINGDANSAISGIRITKAFTNSNEELRKFSIGNNGFVDAKRAQYKTMSLFHSSVSLTTHIFNAICLLSGGIFLYNGEITFGDYSAFILSINVFINPITSILRFFEVFQEGWIGFERFINIMKQPEEEDKSTAKDYNQLSGTIEFKDVCFGYKEDSDKEVLNNMSFILEKGKTLALVGPSGGGKTTICHLLPKFYHIDKGEILIDGINIEDIKTQSLRKNIGIVQQDVFLFSGSFYSNILYGRLDASKEEVIDAAKKANIYDYIMSLPEGFDTQIGERGIKLSGGQKQRLSIARVFLKNPNILILDEATSALDNTTELLIQESLNSLKQGRTTIIVAHRLSTIKDADEILVVANGKVIEKGTHDSLLEINDGLYKSLYDSQLNNKKIASKLMMN